MDRMKSERKEALLAIKENIEMKLFSSEECCTVIQTQEEKKDSTFDQVSENLLKFPGGEKRVDSRTFSLLYSQTSCRSGNLQSWLYKLKNKSLLKDDV